MIIGIPKEKEPGERRIPLTPQTAQKLVNLEIAVRIESGMGESCGYGDDVFAQSGSEIVSDRSELLSTADLIFRVNKPPLEEVGVMKRASAHISFLDPFRERKLVEALAEAGVSAISVEMIPRTTRAQKMDALSSQASLAGYVAVILAAEAVDLVFPMMMTPAGTLSPSRVFVIGAGVAGLQAIATAKRLGARVEAFDTRPAVAEQVRSLGARFVEVDLGETGETREGYARTLTEEQLDKQRQEMARRCAQADVVITTAQVFGRPAPVIVTEDIIRSMKPGSVVVDLAVESGGNVEGSKLDREVEVGGVRILGYPRLAGRVPVHASQMYAGNLASLVEEFWDKEKGVFKLDESDEILQSCLITREGSVVSKPIKEAYGL